MRTKNNLPFHETLAYKNIIRLNDGDYKTQRLGVLAREFFGDIIDRHKEERARELYIHRVKKYRNSEVYKKCRLAYYEKNKKRVIKQARQWAIEHGNKECHNDFEWLMNETQPNLKTGMVSTNMNILPSGYIITVVHGRTYYVHRLIMMKKLGKFIPEGKECNHKNFNRGDNRASNLNLLTHKKNMEYSQRAGRCTGGSGRPKGSLGKNKQIRK